ncbi:MAG: hypothetical protein ACR2PJ_05515, partial [Pseudomonadales bacterium]
IFESVASVQPFFEDAYAYAVFPRVAKGGLFFIGGARGKGRVYLNDKHLGNVTLTKATIGPQLGGQAFSEIVFMQDKRAFDEFTSGSFEMDATASAVAITAGVQAQKGTGGTAASANAGPAAAAQADYGYTKGMAIFIHAIGGLMYELSVGGQKFKYKPLASSKTH